MSNNDQERETKIVLIGMGIVMGCTVLGVLAQIGIHPLVSILFFGLIGVGAWINRWIGY